MNLMKSKLKIFIAVVLAFAAIQLIPYGRNHSNPPVVAEPNWDSTETSRTFARLCGDCHSHQTVWPAYSSIAPVSWLVQSDVDEGREHFNVSMWNVQKKNEGHKAAEAFAEGEMPPWFYTIPRPETRISDREKAAFRTGLEATFGRRDGRLARKDD